MKTLLFVETNAFNMLVSYDENKIVRYVTEGELKNEILPNRMRSEDDFAKDAMECLKSVEEDDTWNVEDEPVDNVEEWLGVDYADPNTPRIIAEIQKEI